MHCLQKHHLEWNQTEPHKWALRDKANGWRELASLTLSDQQWTATIKNPNAGETTFRPLPFREAKAAAESEAFKLWEGRLTMVADKALDKQEKDESLEVEIY